MIDLSNDDEEKNNGLKLKMMKNLKQKGLYIHVNIHDRIRQLTHCCSIHVAWSLALY